MDIAIGLLIPFLGTSIGAACVFFLKKEICVNLQRVFDGFAAGVMVAASVWSLLIPAMEMCDAMGRLQFVPALAGFLLGVSFLLFLDRLSPQPTMLMLAVSIHNLPEGAALGAVYAGVLSGNELVTMAGAFTLATGIAIQNIPEGAIISLPLRSEGSGRMKAFGLGVLSGAIEPVAAFGAIVLASLVTPILPYMLGFAAGAMIYVVVEELIPEAGSGEHSALGTFSFVVGFALMMALDVALG